MELIEALHHKVVLSAVLLILNQIKFCVSLKNCCLALLILSGSSSVVETCLKAADSVAACLEKAALTAPRRALSDRLHGASGASRA